jgi:hypothetical protein
MSSQWIPRGFHTVAPNIVADDAEQAVAFFKKAFGATETYRLTMSNGKIAHCELKLGDSVLTIGESMEGWPAHGLVAQKTRTGCSSVRLTWTPCPPEYDKWWLQVSLGCIQLSPSCPFRRLHTLHLLRPARSYPRFLGYGAPHSSTRGTLTLLNNTLLRTHCARC